MREESLRACEEGEGVNEGEGVTEEGWRGGSGTGRRHGPAHIGGTVVVGMGTDVGMGVDTDLGTGGDGSGLAGLWTGCECDSAWQEHEGIVHWRIARVGTGQAASYVRMGKDPFTVNTREYVRMGKGRRTCAIAFRSNFAFPQRETATATSARSFEKMDAAAA